MASRRKSAKPTNKIRHQLQIDDDVEEDVDDSMEPRAPAPNITTNRDTMNLKTLSNATSVGQKTAKNRTSLFDQSHGVSEQYPTLSQTATEPHIALPSDIYQDFEALKSATNMDTTELMRKLLTDYHKIASSSQPQRERKLDDVINDLFASRSANALDLSKRKGTDQSCRESGKGSQSASIISHGFTDDQLAMGILDKTDVTDDAIDLKPLDLTLNKSQQMLSADDELTIHISEKRQLNPSICSPNSTFFATSKDAGHYSQAFKHAGSYVINLETGSENSSFGNSSLAQVLRMDIPLHNFSGGSVCSTGSQETVYLREGARVLPLSKKSTSEGNVKPCQNKFRSKLFQEDKEPTTLFKTTGDETASAESSMSCLPSYAEAVTSVLNHNQSKRTFGGNLNESSAGILGVDTSVQDRQSSSTMSFVHINTDANDVKVVPLNLDPLLLAAGSTCEDNSKQQHNLLHQLLQHQLKSENKSLQQQMANVSTSQAQSNSNAMNTFCGGPISQVQMMHIPGTKSDLADVQGMAQTIKNNEVSYPNFLLESHAVGIPSLSSALSAVTMSSNTLPNTSVPLSTFFMTTSANGGLGHMVAIPVIHAVPDGITGLQPFAFAPHPLPLHNNSSTVTTSGSTDIILSPQSALTVDISSAQKQSEKQQNEEQPGSISCSLEAGSSPPLGTMKPKPGRPRGRGGRAQSQKTQNKDMKLLTENTLFPGVYTSILKLPWSRRSRNKTKTKTISELKKQAQIIAHSRVNESTTNCVEEIQIKEEITDEDKNNTINFISQTYSQNITEKLPENQHLEQDQQDHNQRHQIQQQKLKDFEQQQRLHMQYHLRLQEEQQKLTKQIEQSYMNMSSDSTVPITFAVSNEQPFLVKQEIQNIDSLHRECSGLAVSVGPSLTSDTITFTSPLLSREPVMMVYSNADINTPKKTPRKRGRPPKIPNLPSKSTDINLTFNAATMAGALQKYEPENFLHTTVATSTYSTSSVDTKPHTSVSLFPQHLLTPEKEESTSVIATKFEDDREIALVKKINFLTNKIGLELSQGMLVNPSGTSILNQPLSDKCEDESGNLEDTMFQEMKMAINKSLVDVKPRRKKVSRLLKSDENFMYATFKIKPKGLTPRKTRKRRKDVLTSTAVVAETIANLRQKALRDSVTPCPEVDSSRPPSMVAWKFHEQYPCSNEEEESRDRTMVCVKCGNCFPCDNEDSVSRQCEACLVEQTEFLISNDRHEITMSNISKMNVEDTEMKAECCMACGDIFQKHFSDPSARCYVCRSNAPLVIKSSKLFSFYDSPKDANPTGLSASQPSTAATFLSVPDLSVKDRKFLDKGLTRTNNNHLFCSLCRMEFTKICDYLSHIRDTHETKLEDKTLLLSAPNDLSRKPKISKTKKSLAHKTLTCPVEECPHFFREQKELDLHLMKKHSNLSTCFPGESFSTSEDLESSTQQEYSMSTNTASAEPFNGLNTIIPETVSSPEKTSPAVNACEKPLQCEFCDYRCRQKNALTWHMRKHPEAASQYRKYSNLNAD